MKPECNSYGTKKEKIPANVASKCTEGLLPVMTVGNMPVVLGNWGGRATSVIPSWTCRGTQGEVSGSAPCMKPMDGPNNKLKVLVSFFKNCCTQTLNCGMWDLVP